MAAMFSNTRSVASSSGHIVEFKAGRSRLEAGSGDTMRKVVAEPKKGLVFIKQSNDMLIHFCWKDRETGAVVDDLIIFPDDAEFKAVPGCPDGKVYMLKFKSGDMKLFWIQDSTPDVDKDLVKKVTDALNKPPTSRPAASRSAGSNANTDRQSAGGSLISSSDMNAPLGGIDQGQLMSLIQSLQGGNSDTLPISSVPRGEDASSEADCEPSTNAAEEGSSNPLSLNNPAIQQIFNNLGRSQKKEVAVSLATALSNETVAEVARNHAEELAPHLPTSDDPARELSETVRTPQFRQAADTLGHALQTGQLGPVVAQFGMDEATVGSANQGDIRGFAANLTKAEGGEDAAKTPRVDNPICRRAVMPSAYLGFFSPSIAATVSRLENSDDDATREPEPKRNRPDNEDMDVD
ncbi:Proteasomal ubiquitin receptor ADRM1 homolog [Caenorhabditis elegans]|uniref:Proteasomal ubiquitin receptor ADRM1 homolog n=1 Tax=Caenorhabditis elegans TaxID=6239 RepID=A0A2K5ATW5_CAEEL|nr:Proteasomal ubiquitin receptor ADRM1 [Caenorhabditis elegans]SPC47541.1 Proteasomal ubiquitin receptor ADRM1 [Caenorhabditis elegans]|eukprot:NP_001348746.1 Proteasomal ubiquitin receptor ADRM1 homolog [Caenorhabditis elegans]